MSDSFYLQSAAGEKLMIDEGESSVGRAAERTLMIPSPKVSGYHALITRQGNSVWIEDKNSSNGTFVNEERLSPGRKQQVQQGDRVKFSAGIVYTLYQITAREHTVRIAPSFYSEPTRFLCAAVHLHPLIYDQFRAYDKFKYKAHPPEYYIDLERIRAEAQKGHHQERLRRLIHLMMLVFMFVLWNISPLSAIRLLPVVWFITWLINIFFDYHRQKYVREHFLDFNIHTDYQVKPDEQNIIVYSGFSPFVGAGVELRDWSVTIDLTKPAEVGQFPRSITEAELLSEVAEAVENLKIPEQRQKDLLFVAGTDLRDQKEILPNIFERPNTTVDPRWVERHIGKEHLRIRHYRMIQVPVWHGQLVLSIYLRVFKQGESLIVESNPYLLTPLSPFYAEVDTFTAEIGQRVILRMIFSNLISSFFAWLGVVVWVLQRIALELTDLAETERAEIRSNYRYDYGRWRSFRQHWSDNKFYRYFQKLDQATYFSILNERVLDALADALEARGIAVDKLREQSNLILNQFLNQGLMISGGNINAENLAVGPGAVIKNLLAATQFRQNGNQAQAIKQSKPAQQK